LFQAGWRRVFTPSAKIIHLDGGAKSTSQVTVRMFVKLQKRFVLFHRKNLGAGLGLRLSVFLFYPALFTLPLGFSRLFYAVIA
jgi:GT2 family glycosyltransferase